MTDKERMDLLYHMCEDTRIMIETEQKKYENAMFEYFQALNRHNETVAEYLRIIQKLLKEDSDM